MLPKLEMSNSICKCFHKILLLVIIVAHDIHKKQVILEIITYFFSGVTNVRPLTNKQQVILEVILYYR